MKLIIKLCACVLLAAAAVTAVSAESGEGQDAYVYSYAEVLSEKGTFGGVDIPSDAVLFEESEEETEESEEDGEERDEASADDGKNGADEEKATGEADRDIMSFTTVAGSDEASVIKYNKKDYIHAPFGEETEELSVSFDLSDREAETEGKSIGVGFRTFGAAGAGVVMPYINVRLTVSDGEREYYTCLPVAAGVSARIFADISSLGDFTPQRVSISFSCDGSIFDAESVTLTEPYCTGSYDFTYQRTGGLAFLSVMKGGVKVGKTTLTAKTSAGDASFVMGEVPYSSETAQEDTSAVRYLSVGCQGEAASVTASGLDSLSNTGTAFSIGDGTGSAVFRLDGPAYRGTFVSLKSSEERDLVIDELELHATSESTASTAQSLTSLTISEGKLCGEGKLDYDTVKAYSSCYIGVFMIPAVGEAEPVLLGRVSVASRFSFEISVKEYPHAASDYMFYAAIVDSDGVAVKISEPRFVSSAGVKSTVKSLYGLYGVGPVSVYESGAAHVMVDVDIFRLADPESISNVTISRGGYVFGIDSEYLGELDSDMEFYRSSGVSVYIRLYCSAPIQSRLDGTWLTYIGDGDGEVMLRTDTAEAANMYMALVSFLCSRYPSISSFVLSSGINSAELTGLSYSELYKSAVDIALAARLIYGAAAETSDVFVTLPVCDEGESVFASPEVIASLVAERLMNIGQIPWAVMYTGSECSLPQLSESIIALQHANNTAAASYSIYCYAPEAVEDTVVEDYKELCAAAASSSARVVFLSEKSLQGGLDRTVLNKLKKEMKSESAHIFDFEAVPLNSLDMGRVTGAAPLWDFSASHSTLGWVAGYGIGSLTSAPEALHGEASRSRVLRCVTEETDESVAGIMLCRQAIPLSLSDAPLVEIVYSHDAASAVNTVFVFGSGENRAEFSVPSTLAPDSDGKYRVICDLTEYAKMSSVAYVGVIVYSASAVTFDLSEITAMSTTLDDSAVEVLLKKTAPAEETEFPAVRITVAVLMVIATFILTVKGYTVMKRRDSTLRNIKKRRRC